MTTFLDNLLAGPDSERWLTAHNDPLAGIYTFSSCLALSDLGGDGDFRLVIADLGSGEFNMKLRVFKGTQQVTENTIIDLPTGVVTFHMDTNEPRIPAIAVASGSHIYIYKNLRPYFKFTLPTLDIQPAERDIWDQAARDTLNTSQIYENLSNLRNEIGDARLTARTQRLLMLDSLQEVEQFVETHKSFPLKRQTVVTCIDTLNKSYAEEGSVACLVLGTESSSVYILDPEAFTIMDSLALPSPPVFLTAAGLYDVEYRILVVCRDGSLCYLKRGWPAAKIISQLDSQAVGLIRREKNLVIATMDNRLFSFTTKGKKVWQIKLPTAVTCLEQMNIPGRGLSLVAVALASAHVLIYDDKNIIDHFKMDETVSAMRFGRFGREDNTLVLVTCTGTLAIKILKRTAHFENLEITSAPLIGQNTKLNIPKKTKLFVDQTMRERESATLMHRVFQHDLYQLRLNTARAFVSALETSSNPVSSDPEEPIKLTAQVMGLGPMFRLIIVLSNTSSNIPSRNLYITFYCDDKLYKVQKPLILVPMLVPGLNYQFETLVESMSEMGIADQIRVFVSRNERIQPILSAIINMPVSEMV
ncbi:Bardet-Biedl syndrome 1 protein homolog isoform X2 [Eurytemora carolleeae]|uniref:Bardet-Biedl syndrome 1 protein homolog isoform X2 n=1 Tax=Eurytemora carolleeae TaxID=1294199 RepID=UPI000C757B50|nr:Bardet-Biedl syndrome 1 protein homolog isoform X2 [Eurytemora carolleeae]|eukprot:XP_023347799.1 Bardet-Biedl syndrome 1 protein homolog isoform X2 [Eurytemora affinis]